MDSEMDLDSSEEVDNSKEHRKYRYLKLLNAVEDLAESEDTGLNTVQKVGSILSEAYEIHDQCDPDERMKSIDETCYDYKTLTGCTNLLIKCTSALDTEVNVYEPKEFCRLLLGGARILNLEAFREDVNQLIPDNVSLSSVYSACDFTSVPVPKERKARQKASSQQAVEKNELIKVENKDKDREDEDMVVNIYNILKRECAKRQSNNLDYYDFVVDTSSFSNTVENIFYTAFLVQQGKVGLRKEDDVLKICIIPKKNRKSHQESNKMNYNWIPSINMDFWMKFSSEGYLQKHKKQKQ